MHSMGTYGFQEPKTILHSGNSSVNNSAEHSAILHILQSQAELTLVAKTNLRSALRSTSAGVAQHGTGQHHSVHSIA